MCKPTWFEISFLIDSYLGNILMLILNNNMLKVDFEIVLKNVHRQSIYLVNSLANDLGEKQVLRWEEV